MHRKDLLEFGKILLTFFSIIAIAYGYVVFLEWAASLNPDPEIDRDFWTKVVLASGFGMFVWVSFMYERSRDE